MFNFFMYRCIRTISFSALSAWLVYAGLTMSSGWGTAGLIVGAIAVFLAA